MTIAMRARAYVWMLGVVVCLVNGVIADPDQHQKKVDTAPVQAAQLVLENQLLKIADGMPGMFDGKKVADIITLYKLLGALLEDAHKKESSEDIAVCRQAFKNTTRQFMESAKGTKSFMHGCIGEFCYKVGRSKSLLLDWAQVPEGEEDASIDRNITTMDAYETFCRDLRDFLMCLLHSCPKACEQYRHRMKNPGK